MEFEARLPLHTQEVLQNLGYRGNQPDAHTQAVLQKAEVILQENAAPRWVYQRFGLQKGTDIVLPGTGIALQGGDIAAHLQGCYACFLFAVTLGLQVDTVLRQAQVEDMALAVVLDMAASVLVDQYAQTAQEFLQSQAAQTEEFATGRFSPGYGDLPIQLQPAILQAINAGRAIGLTASQSNILLPRKSITAVIGVSNQPVFGKLAGCATCALRNKCGKGINGKPLCQR